MLAGALDNNVGSRHGGGRESRVVRWPAMWLRHPAADRGEQPQLRSWPPIRIGRKDRRIPYSTASPGAQRTKMRNARGRPRADRPGPRRRRATRRFCCESLLHPGCSEVAGMTAVVLSLGDPHGLVEIVTVEPGVGTCLRRHSDRLGTGEALDRCQDLDQRLSW